MKGKVNTETFKKEIKKELGIDINNFRWIPLKENLERLLRAKTKTLKKFLSEIDGVLGAIDDHKRHLKWLHYNWNNPVVASKNRRFFEERHSNDFTYYSKKFPDMLWIRLAIDVSCSASYIYTDYCRCILKDGEKYNLCGGKFLSYQKELQKLRKIVDFIITKRESKKQHISKAA